MPSWSASETSSGRHEALVKSNAPSDYLERAPPWETAQQMRELSFSTHVFGQLGKPRSDDDDICGECRRVPAYDLVWWVTEKRGVMLGWWCACIKKKA